MFALFLLGCDDVGHIAAKAIPALEHVDPSWGAPKVDCEAQRPPPKPRRGCVMETISCGDIIEGTTKGGKNHFGDTFYTQGTFTPQHNDYELSPEAIYQLKLDPNVKADIRMDSNCAELDLFAMAWDKTTCPNEKHAELFRGRESEFDDYPGGGSVVLTTVDRAQNYLVGVDGKYGEAGNFRLTINCYLYR